MKSLLILVVIVCHLFVAFSEAKKIKSTSKSDSTTKILQTDSKTQAQLDYSYYTLFEYYDDGTSQNFLVGKLTLKNLQTQKLWDDAERSSIRLSVGWRNPQEDAYDITSINIKYNKNAKDTKFKCEDGYANGSVSTAFYNGKDSTNIGAKDQRGRHNITIKEWTDNTIPANNLQFRVPEVQNCEMVSGKVSEFPSLENDKQKRKQTFEATYKRPLKGKGLDDVDLLMDSKYNITSYFGCYSRIGLVSVLDNGVNPDIYWESSDAWSCRGQWQGQLGTIYYNSWDSSQKKEVTKSRVGEHVESQFTVKLLKYATKLGISASIALSLFVLQ